MHHASQHREDKSELQMAHANSPLFPSMLQNAQAYTPRYKLSTSFLGTVVHTNVPLFTKQYIICQRACMWLPFTGPMNKGSIVVAVLRRSHRSEPRSKLATSFLPSDATQRLSRLSVCLSVCDVEICFSHRFEYFENNFMAE